MQISIIRKIKFRLFSRKLSHKEASLNKNTILVSIWEIIIIIICYRDKRGASKETLQTRSVCREERRGACHMIDNTKKICAQRMSVEKSDAEGEFILQKKYFFMLFVLEKFLNVSYYFETN